MTSASNGKGTMRGHERRDGVYLVDMKKNSDKGWRRRLSVATLVVGCTVAGVSGTASAQYVTPSPPGGSSTDSQTDPGGTSSSALEAAGTQPLSLSLTGTNDRAAQTATQTDAATGQGGAGQSLPITGGDVVALTGLGLGAVALGALLLGARRRGARA